MLFNYSLDSSQNVAKVLLLIAEYLLLRKLSPHFRFALSFIVDLGLYVVWIQQRNEIGI